MEILRLIVLKCFLAQTPRNLKTKFIVCDLRHMSIFGRQNFGANNEYQ
jgi:hypothetical protein